MKIDSGAAPLSLALLKALGGQQAPAAATAAAKPPQASAQAAPAPKVSTPPEGDAAPARNLPRGSFVDLRV